VQKVIRLVSNQGIWIGIVIAAFFVGMGGTYLIFHTGSSDVNEDFNMMMNNQEMMMQDPQFRQQVMESITQDPSTMRLWMENTQHAEEMATMMKGNHDFTMEMMFTMIEDPALRLQMIGHLAENPEAMQQMMKMMDSEIQGEGMMMNQDMMDSMMSNMQFNTGAPLTIPMIDGYYNGEKVYFIHTEISDKDIADMMSTMINFPTLHVPDLDDISQDDLGKVYIFTNGITGSGPYGGGPFFFQIDIFDSVPGMNEYHQFRVPQLVTWNEDSNPILLTSIQDLFEAETNGELSIESTDFVVNAPMIVWTSDGATQTASMIQNMFESMSGVEGELTFVDKNNYVAIFKLHSDKDMGMMGMSP